MAKKNPRHLSHIQQEDLEEEAQSSACDLIGGSADGVTQLAPESETVLSSTLLKDRGDVVISAAPPHRCRGGNWLVSLTPLQRWLEANPHADADVCKLPTAASVTARLLEFTATVGITGLQRFHWLQQEDGGGSARTFRVQNSPQPHQPLGLG